jgi:hypothetical protein
MTDAPSNLDPLALRLDYPHEQTASGIDVFIIHGLHA